MPVEFIVVLVVLMMLGAAFVWVSKEPEAEPKVERASNDVRMKFISATNNSGKTLYRAVVNGKVWTASDKAKLQAILRRI